MILVNYLREAGLGLFRRLLFLPLGVENILVHASMLS